MRDGRQVAVLDVVREVRPPFSPSAVVQDFARTCRDYRITRLERRVSRGGRDRIDHGPHGHRDVVNAAAGALVLAGEVQTYSSPLCGDPDCDGTFGEIVFSEQAYAAWLARHPQPDDAEVDEPESPEADDEPAACV